MERILQLQVRDNKNCEGLVFCSDICGSERNNSYAGPRRLSCFLQQQAFRVSKPLGLERGKGRSQEGDNGPSINEGR